MYKIADGKRTTVAQHTAYSAARIVTINSNILVVNGT